MHQFDRQTYPTSRATINETVDVDTTVAHSLGRVRRSALEAPADTFSDSPLKSFAPFRSYRDIKADQIEVLKAIEQKHVGTANHHKFHARTLQSSTERSISRQNSFNGTRSDLVVPENAFARSLAVYIEDSLKKIFPSAVSTAPTSQGSSLQPVIRESKDGIVDSRKHSPQLGFMFAKPDDDTVTSAWIGESGGRQMPLSPFSDASSNPPPQAYQSPAGLGFLLERIRRRDIMSIPPFNPAVEAVSRTDPPMPRDRRDEESSANVRRAVRRQCRIGRSSLKMDANLSDLYVTSSQRLYEHSETNKKQFGGFKHHSSLTPEPRLGIPTLPSLRTDSSVVSHSGSSSFFNDLDDPLSDDNNSSFVLQPNRSQSQRFGGASRRTKESMVSFGDVLSLS